jgi:predicted phosphodiesterase
MKQFLLLTKKIILVLLIMGLLLMAVFGFLLKTTNNSVSYEKMPNMERRVADKGVVMTIVLVTDTHNWNDNLQTAIDIAKGSNAQYVIHLGDLSNVGTLEELRNAKEVLDNSGLKYWVLPGDHEYYVSEWNKYPMIENFREVFGDPDDWLVVKQDPINSKFEILNSRKDPNVKFQDKEIFLFVHTPLYPLGKDADLLDKVRKSNIKAVFAGDAHFSSETADSVRKSLKHFVIGALTKERNLQTPRFSVLRIYSGGEYNVEEIVLN